MASGAAVMPARKIEVLADAPRSGAPRSIDDKKVDGVLTKIAGDHPRLEPTGAAVSWLKKLAFRSIRCCEFGAPLSSNPHRVDSFKLSAELMFGEKVRDIVGFI